MQMQRLLVSTLLKHVTNISLLHMHPSMATLCEIDIKPAVWKCDSMHADSEIISAHLGDVCWECEWSIPWLVSKSTFLQM